MLSPQEIAHIAELARLEITPEETKKYSRELSAVLDYIEQLEEAEVSPEDQVMVFSALQNVFRADEPEDWDTQELNLSLEASDRENGLVKVKKVL